MKTPLYFLAFMTILFLSSIVSLNVYQDKLIKNVDKFKRYKKLSTKFIMLKENWADSDLMLKKVDSVIKYAGINDAIIEQTNTEYKVKIKKIDIKTTHKLLNKLLNENINLLSISIKRESLSFSIGII
jgi:aspartokinase